MSTAALPLVNPSDLTTDQPVRWCPGCGNFSILAQLKQALASADVARERLVFVSGYGCAGRIPYYLNTFGFHTLPGRAAIVATGLKAARPDLSVWVVLGDGDALSAGGNHLMHALRRNVDIKVLCFNNEIFGLTRGQASPTSRPGTRSKTTPDGSFERSARPLPLAVAADATFVARTWDVDAEHFTEVIRRAAEHRGSAFVEIYQNCHVFNDGAFGYSTDPSSKAETTILLEDKQPMLLGKNKDYGLRLNGIAPEVVPIGAEMPLDDVLVHDEHATDATMAWILSRMAFPDLPECFGVLRAIDLPTYEGTLRGRRSEEAASLQEILVGDDSWTVA